MDTYDPSIIEPKWQQAWEKWGLDKAEDFSKKKKFYLLVEFPYCSGAGLHIGHARPWLPVDAVARKKRMDGFNVMFPFGWDAFGLPTENYAIKTGRPPAEITAENIKHFKQQAKSLGLSFDWSREVNTSDPGYYRWTQWIFVQLFKKDMAYQDEVDVNWCPACKTNLADEEVMGNGNHERCGQPTEKRKQKQWLLRITKYADRLIDDLKKVDYPTQVATQQVNWIGKKEGASVKFGEIEIFTTRVDTIFGATFLVLSPSHPLANKVKTVVNPATKKEIPVFVDEYVLDTFGTGAIMGVPAYDERDEAFAKKKGMTIYKDFELVDPDKIIADLGPQVAKKTFTLHLHDWVFSRQHYWGEPIPIIHCPKCGPVAVSEDRLPVELPFLEKYQPSGTGESPLAAATDWLVAKCPSCGAVGRRETDTMPNWAGSNWYFVRYVDPNCSTGLADRKLMDYWLPVDVYEGGFEHTTLHLLYSRFIYKFLFDIGVVPTDEPYTARRVHGILLASDNRKMSKSLGNVIDPMEIVKKFGSDTLRLYEMFIGPFDQQVSWNDRSLAGCSRFLNRVWDLAQKPSTGSTDPVLQSKLVKTINKVSKDIDQMKFNTAVATMMELINTWEKAKGMKRSDLENFLKVLAPLAPHLAEELWQKLGHTGSVHQQSWPKVTETAAEKDYMTVVITINGKPKATLQLSTRDAKVLDQAQIVTMGQTNDKVKKFLEGKKIVKTIYVPGKILNFVVV
jgi:leucyl-tRNA synthetase